MSGMRRWNIAGITTVSVALDMGIEPTPELMWAVGQIVVRIYREQYGALPPKDLRPKTYEEGVHCFAIYPETFRGTIARVLLTQKYELARQLDLFAKPKDPRQGELFGPGGEAYAH